MALQLDRHGLWNLLGPSLFALGILATAWVRLGGLGAGRSQQDLGAGTWVSGSQFKVGWDPVVITAAHSAALQSWQMPSGHHQGSGEA